MKEGRTKMNKIQPVPLGPLSSHEDTNKQCSDVQKRPNAVRKRSIATKRAVQPFLVLSSEKISRNVPRMSRKNLSGKRGPRDVFEEEERI